MTESKHSVRFPGESDSYRAARNELLDAEIELRLAVESVAEKRRELPLGGELSEVYLFEEAAKNGDPPAIEEVHQSGPFADDKNTLILYSFMFGLEMKEACPLCTSILDGLGGEAPHVVQQMNLAVVAKSPVPRLRAFAERRGWRNLASLVVGALYIQPRLLRRERFRRPVANAECFRQARWAHLSLLCDGAVLRAQRARTGWPSRGHDLAAMESFRPHPGGSRPEVDSPTRLLIIWEPIYPRTRQSDRVNAPRRLRCES